MNLDNLAAKATFSLPITLLVVDDDQAILRKVRKESLQQTNMGVLVAENLADAVALVESNIEIGAVLVDMNFRLDTQDETRSLHSGIDFLEFINKTHQSLPKYVLSVDALDPERQFEARNRGIQVKNWYDKLQSQGQLPAWVGIERDLIRSALLSNPELRDSALVRGLDPAEIFNDGVAEKVRTMFRYPRTTFIQELESSPKIHVVSPIEVLCWERDGAYFALAKKIPLLAEAEGTDAVDAIETLSDQLLFEFRRLGANEGRLDAYAQFVYEALKSHLSVDDPRPSQEQ